MRLRISRLCLVSLASLAALSQPVLAQPTGEDAPRFSKTLVQGAGGSRIFHPDQGSWPLTSAEPQTRVINYAANLRAPTLSCVYRQPGNRDEMRMVTLWRGSRPDLSQATDLDGINGVKRSLTADIAVAACPPSWGAAMSLIWGPNALSDLQALHKRREQREAEREAAWVAQETGKAQSQAQAWQAEAAAQAPTTAAADLALAQQVQRDLDRLEANIDELNSRPFDTMLRGETGDRILRLAQIAHLKSKGLSANGAGRAAFDAWDNKLGGPALTAIVRIEKIIHARMNRRVRLSEISSGDAGQREMESWGNVDLSRFYPAKTTLLDFISQQLDGKQLVDANFLKKIASDLERERPSGDPGLPYYRYVPAERKPAWMMSPAEQEAQQGSRVAEGAINFVGEVGNMIRLIEKMNADVRIARQAFWKCYATRCKDAGKAFYAYSQALSNKDQWVIFRPLVIPGLLAPGMAMLGDANVDGGNIQGCNTELQAIDQALAPAARSRQSDPVGAAQLVAATLKAPVYENWRACRDRMEYILRPRFP